MRFQKDKRLGLDKIGKYQYLKNYHEWLKKEREKDKEKLPYKKTEMPRVNIRKGRCPYCKKSIIEQSEDDKTFKICEKHGLLQIKYGTYFGCCRNRTVSFLDVDDDLYYGFFVNAKKKRVKKYKNTKGDRN